MASARKKQDEKNLKILRELVSLPHNKYCFDCNQRGPTYVNVTIGSFVCTKCSGMLRGLTPPHRVKSISMAAFTPEEIEFVRTRGNDYCRRSYLGLYEGAPPTEARDEQQIRDFMVDKYERRRYYMEPSMTARNGHTQQQNLMNSNSNKLPEMKPISSLISEVKPVRVNGTTSAIKEAKTQPTRNIEFIADFASADIFNSANNNTVQQSFANFDNNPVFNNTNSKGDFSIFDLKFTNNGPVLNHVPLFPKCQVNRWSMPPTSTPSFFNSQPQQQNNNLNGVKTGPPAPPEDRYAALKDLDNALKAQPTLDWNSGSSNSLYSSSTNAGSLYSSPSPQSSMYGSPSQSSQFATIFSQEPTAVSNPFNNGSLWNTNGSAPHLTNGSLSGANPFRTPDPFKPDPFKINGINAGFPTMAFPQPINGTAWTPNPFKLGAASSGHSNNPFL